MVKARSSSLLTKITVLVVVCFFSLQAQGKYGGGSGTAEEPYLIYDEFQMNTIGANQGDWSMHFLLCTDIDLSGFTGKSFNIIGNSSTKFRGVFDGNGNTISNFTYISNDKNHVGLFGYVKGGEIKNLGLIATNINAGAGWYVGSLVGYLLEGTISNCYVQNIHISGTLYVGGLVGYNDGTISNCCSYSIGAVLGESAGGLAGYNLYGAISNCYSTVKLVGNSWIGGLVGCNWYGTISNCYSSGSVTGNHYVGGLVGYNQQGQVFGSYWDVETSGQETSAGGTGLTTAEMQMQVTFTNAGWDFNTPVWTIDEGVDYPRLWWEFVPTLHAEPEITLGNSNTISWEPTVDDVEYYAECAEDANFTNIHYNSGWITETSFEFTGLELGKRYWYSVKARNTAGVETNWSNIESSLQCSLSYVVETLLKPESLKNKNMKEALLNKINEALNMIDEGLYRDALNKVQNDILQKTDGCADTGQPDNNDWIITCEEQAEVYPLIIETIEHIKTFIE